MEHLSQNLVQVLTTIVSNNRELAEYLIDSADNPLTDGTDVVQTVLNNDYNKLIMKYVKPFPFDDITETLQSEIRVFFHHGEMETKSVISNNILIFDILVPKVYWLINDGQPKIRAYEIMRNIINKFDDKSVGTIGQLNFTTFAHLMVNDKISGVRLFAEMTMMKV
jgi:hypothetical protein